MTHQPDQQSEEQLYNLFCYGRGQVIPDAQFIEALDDERALQLASTIKPWMTREVWQRHRLVRVLPPLR